ncbi:MAG: head-tail connector protein, partial [Bauldia litoralis]
PALEPVSLADVKAHLRVDGGDEDALLTAAIVSARVHVESATRRVLIEQGWRIYYDAWPRRRIVRLPVAPLMSVDAVTIYDAAGDPQVVDAEDYEADVAASPARLVLAATAPTPVGRAVNGIEIDVTAGYGATSVDVPAALRQAVLMLVAHWYEHRGAVGHDLAVLVAPLGFEALIAPYRLLSL